MISEIVVDMNVFVDSSNEGSPNFVDSKKFFELLIGGSVSLCVDEGYDIDERKNQSKIVAEYLNRLVPLSPGSEILKFLFSNARVTMYPKNASEREIQKFIIQIMRNVRDRTFLGVAWNSKDKVLVTHDYKDFQASKRTNIKKRINVSVVEAKDCKKKI